MKRLLTGTLLALLLSSGVAQARPPGAKLLLVTDPHPLTVKRALRAAERRGYMTGYYRRASDRVIHVHVFSEQTIYGDDGAAGAALFTTTLTVRLHRDGRVVVWDSMLAGR